MNYSDDYTQEKKQLGYSYPPDHISGINSAVGTGQYGVAYTPPPGSPPSYSGSVIYQSSPVPPSTGYGQYLQGYHGHAAESSTSRMYEQQSTAHNPPSNYSLQAPGTDYSREASPSTSGMKAKFMGNTASDLFDNPPPGFSRPPPHNDLMKAPFPVLSHISVEASLEKGFPAMIPPSPYQPHPFVVHDVRPEDWERLLNDIKVVSKLSGMDKVISNVAPMAMGVGFVAGMLVTSAVEKNMKKKKVVVVGDVVDHWNHYFFHPRLMEMTLAQGSVVHAGAFGPPPDRPNHLPSSHSSDDYMREHYPERGDERFVGRYGRRTRLGGIGLREDRRERVYARRELRAEERETTKEKWRLIIAFKPQPSM